MMAGHNVATPVVHNARIRKTKLAQVGDRSRAKLLRQALLGLGVDLGNLRNGPDIEESYKRLQAVSHYLMQKGILPIIIGGSHDLDIGQYMAYEEEEKLISVCNIDSRFDIGTQDVKNSENHIHRLFIHEPNYLFNYHQNVILIHPLVQYQLILVIQI